MVLMILFLVIGFVLLVKGADLFVDGACDLSAKVENSGIYSRTYGSGVRNKFARGGG